MNVNKLCILSPDSDNHYSLLDQDWRNLENLIDGVLLYPYNEVEFPDLDDMSMSEEEIDDMIQEKLNCDSVDVTYKGRVRGEDDTIYLAFCYRLIIYNPFRNIEEIFEVELLESSEEEEID